MKKTFTISLGGFPFIIDEDAFYILKNYLDDIGSRLSPGDQEVIPDIEGRIAEILQNRLTLRSQVVSREMIEQAIAVMGRPEEFGEKRRIEEIREHPGERTKRLYRNLDDKIFGGVCSGLAAYFGIDTTLVRVLALILFLFGSMGFWAYIVLWIVIPKAHLDSDLNR